MKELDVFRYLKKYRTAIISVSHQKIFLRDHGFHLNVHADIVRGGLRILDAQSLHGLTHQIGGIDLRGVDNASVRRKPFLGAGSGILDHRDRRILLYLTVVWGAVRSIRAWS